MARYIARPPLAPTTIHVNQRSHMRKLVEWLSALFPPPVALAGGPYRASLPAPRVPVG